MPAGLLKSSHGPPLVVLFTHPFRTSVLLLAASAAALALALALAAASSAASASSSATPRSTACRRRSSRSSDVGRILVHSALSVTITKFDPLSRGENPLQISLVFCCCRSALRRPLLPLAAAEVTSKTDASDWSRGRWPNFLLTPHRVWRESGGRGGQVNLPAKPCFFPPGRRTLSKSP